MKRIFTIFLSALLLLTCVSCKGNGKDSSTVETPSTENSKVEKTDHDFLALGKSDYKIVIPAEDNVIEQQAAEEFNLFFKEATVSAEATSIFASSYAGLSSASAFKWANAFLLKVASLSKADLQSELPYCPNNVGQGTSSQVISKYVVIFPRIRWRLPSYSYRTRCSSS